MHIKIDTLLSPNALENFRKMCLEIYQIGSANFSQFEGSALQAFLKKTKEKFKLLIDVDVLFIIEKGNRGEICHCIIRYTKANNEYLKHCDKNIWT